MRQDVIEVVPRCGLSPHFPFGPSLDHPVGIKDVSGSWCPHSEEVGRELPGAVNLLDKLVAQEEGLDHTVIDIQQCGVSPVSALAVVTSINDQRSSLPRDGGF